MLDEERNSLGYVTIYIYDTDGSGWNNKLINRADSYGQMRLPIIIKFTDKCLHNYICTRFFIFDFRLKIATGKMNAV